MNDDSHNKSGSRRRTRRVGLLALLLSTLLTPAATIVAGAAVTSLLVGGLVGDSALDEPSGATPAQSTPKPRSAKPAALSGEAYVIPIEHDGQALLVALTENMAGGAPDRTGVEPEAPRFTALEETGGTAGPGATPRAALQEPGDPRPRAHGGASGPAAPVGPRQGSPTFSAPTSNRPAPVKLAPEPLRPNEAPTSPAPLRSVGFPAQMLPAEASAPTLPPDYPSDDRTAPPRHAIPEPSAWGLVLLGGAAFAVAKRRRSRPTSPT